MAVAPRGYQLEAREAVKAHPAGGRGALIVSATGTGKTILAHLCAEDVFSKPGSRVVWLAGRSALVEQPLEVLRRHWPDVKGGIYQGKRREVHAQVVYASKDSLTKPGRIEELLEPGPIDMLIVDEAHHSVSPTWRRVIDGIRGPSTKLVGLTATPDRNDSEMLSDLWDVVFSFGILEGIACGALVPPFACYKKIEELDLSGVSMDKNGEYDIQQLEDALLRAHIAERTVEAMSEFLTYERLPFRDESFETQGQAHQCLVYCATVKQARLTADKLCEAGWVARAVWGSMPKADQSRLLAAYKDGKIQVLCNADLLTEGNDFPPAKLAVLARPLESWSLYVQIVGRVLRPFKGYDRAYVLDLVGATREQNIVAAPVLVEGTECLDSPSGRHYYLPIAGTGMGRCTHCAVVVKCVRSRTKAHVFKDGRCKHCGEVQCPKSETMEHKWMPWDDGKQICVHCAKEVPDPLSSLVTRKVREPIEIAWKKIAVPGLEVKGAALGTIGTLISVRRPDGNVLPFLYTRKKLHRLSTLALPADMANMLSAEVATRAEKKGGYYGGFESAEQVREACIEMQALIGKLKSKGEFDG